MTRYFCVVCRSAVPFRLVCTQLLLHGLKLPVMDGIIVMYPPTLAVLVCVFVATEYGDMMASGKHRILLKHPGLFLSATLLGICVNALSVALVGGGGFFHASLTFAENLTVASRHLAPAR